jgi:hypothetical protein
VDDLVPLNRRLNRLDAQVEMIREGGIPTLWVPTDIEMYPKDYVDGAFKMMEYDAPAGWTPEKAVLHAQPLTGNGYMTEREAIMTDAQRIGAPQDVEIGMGDLNNLNTSALMLTSEESAVKRGPRERALIAMFESAWTHDLEMTWAFRKEDAEFEVLSEAGTAERQSFTGADILGQCQVTIKKSAGYDQSIYRKEGIKEAIAANALVLDTPVKRHKFLEDSNLSTDIIEDEAIQIKRAQGAFSSFIKKGIVPALDPSIQEHSVRYDIYGKGWEGDECVEMRDACQFDAVVLPPIYGWELKLRTEDAKEAVTRPIYGNQPPEAWQGIYDEGRKLLAEKAKFDIPPQDPRMPQAPPPPAATFPPPPTQPFLPEALDRRIYAFWARLLGPVMQPQGDPRLPSGEGQQKLTLLLKMRAVLEAHRMLAEQKKQAQMGGAPVAAAPGGGAAIQGGMAA